MKLKNAIRKIINELNVDAHKIQTNVTTADSYIEVASEKEFEQLLAHYKNNNFRINFNTTHGQGTEEEYTTAELQHDEITIGISWFKDTNHITIQILAFPDFETIFINYRYTLKDILLFYTVYKTAKLKYIRKGDIMWSVGNTLEYLSSDELQPKQFKQFLLSQFNINNK
jgi:hypothetical protein